MDTQYKPQWYRSFLGASAQSAREIVPVLIELAAPSSVIDFGCGLGVWLREFVERGVSETCGIDGPHVPRDELLIDRASFLPHDLNQPLRLPRTYDLAVCLEVAEHLPAESAQRLVASLTSAAPIVFFSAAIPAQGGTDHLNEQWLEYWLDRFADCRFRGVDAIRPRIWNNPRVDFWYAQNAVLFVRDDVLERHPRLARERALHPPQSLVHPRLFLQTQQRLERTLDYRTRRLAQQLRAVTRRWCSRR